MNELTLNLTHEEKKAYRIQKFELVDDKSEFAWTYRITTDQLEKMYEEHYQMIQDGDEYQHLIKLSVYEKIKAKTSKIKKFESRMVESLPMAIDMITAEVIKLSGLDQVKVQQTKLVMPKTEEKETVKAVKRVKK